MALFYISAIAKLDARILQVYLHSTEDDGKTFLTGKWSKEAEVIDLIENKAASIRTIRWNYTKAVWDYGEFIEVEKHNTRGKTLRTIKNNLVEDNLDNLIDFPL